MQICPDCGKEMLWEECDCQDEDDLADPDEWVGPDEDLIYEQYRDRRDEDRLEGRFYGRY